MLLKRVADFLKGKVTLLAVFGLRGRVFKIAGPRWVFWGAALVVLALAAGGGVEMLWGVRTESSLARLERENQRLVAKYEVLAETADSLKELANQMSIHDIQLRLESNMEVLPPDVRELGVGGPVIESPAMAELRRLNSPHFALASELSQNIEALVRISRYQKESFDEIEEHLERNAELRTHIPAIVPTTGRFSGRFGYRRDPILGIRKLHCGVDISNKPGTPVMASADGVVSFVGRLKGYGLVVKIDHGHEIETLYAHLSKIYVRAGQQVKRYQLIAAMGSTGRTVGPHLHYEVRVAGRPVNPEGYMLDAEEVFRGQPAWTLPRLLPQPRWSRAPETMD